MRIYVSIDAEGLPGVCGVQQVVPGGRLFEEFRAIATRVVKAVVEELKALGVEEVWVADSHGDMLNVDYLQMPRGTVLVRGYPRPICMVTGIDRGFAAAMFIGYHSAAGTPRSVLDHTFSGRAFHEIRVCGRKASEFYVNALVAGHFNVPIALVAGDDKLEREVEEVAPWVTYVQVKESVSRYATITKPLDEVVEELREGIQQAVNSVKQGKCKPLKPPRQPIDLEIVVRKTEYADAIEQIPGMQRIDAYTLRYLAKNPIELANVIEIATYVAIAIDTLTQRR